jgi:arylsulfatase A-like enzyme
VIEWPARIREPRVSAVSAVTSDLLPTLCAIVGRPLPQRPLDGIDLTPLIDGRMDRAARADLLLELQHPPFRRPGA